jgi:hypothetical protein
VAGATGTLPRVGAADRLRSWGRGALRNPWLIAGLVVVVVLALIAVPFIWAFRVIRASARSDEGQPDAKPDSDGADEQPGPESEATAG